MLQQKQVKSVLNKHKKRDSWFLDDYSVNPYGGCSCNCLYCYIRGSKYGENMNEHLTVKQNLPELLEKQLAARAKKQQYGFVAVGSGTDAYMPHEEKERLTESTLHLLLKYRFPVFISTKRALILRDIQLLKEIDNAAILPPDLAPRLKRGVILSVSVSTMDESISKVLEPGALSPTLRMQLLGQLKAEGFLSGVNAIPLLPFLSDSSEKIEEIILAAKAQQADYLLAGGLTLFGKDPADSKTLFYAFLQKYHPALLPEYERLYGDNFYTSFAYQRQLKQRAALLCKQYQLRNTILE